MFYFAYFAISLFVSEIAFRLSAFGSLSGLTVYFILFVLSAAALLSAVCTALPEKAGRTVSFVFTVFLLLFYGVGLVYRHIFGSFLSLAQVGMGGAAIKSFWKETLIGIAQCWFYIILLLLPLAFLIIRTKREKKAAASASAKTEAESAVYDGKHSQKSSKPSAGRFAVPVALLAAAAVLHTVSVLALPLSGSAAYSPKDIYNDSFVLAMSQKHFGDLTSARLELRGLLFGTGTGSIVAEEPAPSEGPEETPQEEQNAETAALAPKKYQDNKLAYDFAKLSANRTDDRLKAIDDYMATRTPTKKNEYSGMFSGYNVVVLCCESFSPYLIDEERTPALWRMKTEGWDFTDYFGTVNDNTSNSEYALITGLLPDQSLLGKGWDTFYDFNSCTLSKNNYLPFCLGNKLRQRGFRSYGVHYYYNNYYGRNLSYPNFGYDFISMNHGLSYSNDWPTSDLQMMEQVVPVLLKPDESGQISRFGAYFMTFSGHMQYNFETNNVARRNRAVADGIEGLSGATKAFVACNQELEYALEYMFDEFEKAGVLDNTLFVLLPDHYPYALGLTKLSELAGKDLEEDGFAKEFNTFKGCLMMYTPSMEPMQIDTTCCELDILPTLLNLLGIEYDSRLLMGVDIFSTAEHVAVLADRSFVTDKVLYNAAEGNWRARTEEPVDEGYVNRLINTVKNKFTVSTEILYTDYYRQIN